MKKIYTTGEVAKLLGININTVIKWFDDGKIQGFRLPGSRERRITHVALVAFMNENGIPMDLLGDSNSVRERRIVPRYLANIPVHLAQSNNGCDANISNISETGALVTISGKMATLFKIGKHRIELDFNGKPLNGITTGAFISNIRPIDSDLVGFGIKFDAGNNDLRTIIRESFAA